MQIVVAKERQPEGITRAEVQELVDRLHRRVVARAATKLRRHRTRDIDQELV